MVRFRVRGLFIFINLTLQNLPNGHSSLDNQRDENFSKKKQLHKRCFLGHNISKRYGDAFACLSFNRYRPTGLEPTQGLQKYLFLFGLQYCSPFGTNGPHGSFGAKGPVFLFRLPPQRRRIIAFPGHLSYSLHYSCLIFLVCDAIPFVG